MRPVTAAAPPVQEDVPHDLEVEMARPLRLKLGDTSAPALWDAMERVCDVFTPAAASAPTTWTTAVVGVTVHWSDPATGDHALPVRDGEVTIPIPPGRARTARFHLTWRSPRGRFELRVPSAPDRFIARILPPRPATVVSGTGTFEGLVFGDQVPVEIHVRDPAGVASATVFYRSASATPFATATMKLHEGTEAEGRWTTALPRPPGLESLIDYYVRIVDRNGRVTHYGEPGMVHRIKLADPTRQREP